MTIKYKEDRPFAKPEDAARELLRLYRKNIEDSPHGDTHAYVGVTNSAFLYQSMGSLTEYVAGRDFGIANKWFEIWGGGTRVNILPAGEEALGTV